VFHLPQGVPQSNDPLGGCNSVALDSIAHLPADLGNPHFEEFHRTDSQYRFGRKLF
jgi:hypothetical protein